MFGRPNLYVSYEQETQIMNTWTKKVLLALFVIVLFLMPFDLPVINQIPVVRFLGDTEWLRIVSRVLVIAIAALGLNLLTGVGGQVSLGHAFFMGVGASAASIMGAAGNSRLWGWELPIWLWLPGAGVTAALVGVIVAPVAVRLRGLYLAIVTLGLVFVGLHMANTAFGRKIAGPPSLGREFQSFDIRIWKEDKPLINMSDDGKWLWFDVTEAQKIYLLFLAITIVMVLLAKNIARTRTGRALQAIRDRDIAAEVMGVHEFRYKLVAFALSSFFAGIAGALFTGLNGQMLSDNFNLFFSVTFIAIILIGGAGTVSGTLIGTFFVVMIPRFVDEMTKWLSNADGGFAGTLSDFALTNGDKGDFGFISTGASSPGWPLAVADWNQILFGLLIIVFLIFEPLGLYGIWIKIRNYWKAWPFSY
jgi:branched-chain amino acid transport system permease protein